jgi:hypothetical protein
VVVVGENLLAVEEDYGDGDIFTFPVISAMSLPRHPNQTTPGDRDDHLVGPS